MSKRKEITITGKKQLQLTDKEKKLVDILIENPSISRSKAYQIAYGKEGRKNWFTTAANTVLAKPEVAAYLERRVQQVNINLMLAGPKAAQNIVSLGETAESEVVKLKANKYIVDSITGADKQQVNIFNILTPDQMRAAIRTSILAAREKEDAIDVTPEPKAEDREREEN